jgi:PIN domain nuclease of toxin-antitoxin system
MMRNTILYVKKQKQATYTLDTCVIRKILENPNYLNCISTHVNFSNSEIVLSKTVLWEIRNQIKLINPDLTLNQILSELQNKINARVKIIAHSNDTILLANDLLSKYSQNLHEPDNQILAFSIIHNATLLSCDSKLIKCAKSEGHSCLNTNYLATTILGAMT